MNIGDTIKNVKDVFPQSINIVNKRVDKVLPEENTVVLESGEKWSYNQLVISAGNVLDFS